MAADLLKQLANAGNAQETLTFQRGIERELLRTTQQGALALTQHPNALGAKLTHPSITTDFSESQLELITPVHPSTEAVLADLGQIHQWTAQRLGDERLWPGSMPCRLPEEHLIPLAYYGDSNLGRLKTTYRHGLGIRYNRTMQTICAVHYNFSFNQPFFDGLHQIAGSQPLRAAAMQTYRSEQYFGLMRNFRSLAWLPAYLFGASPAVDQSFVRNQQHDLFPLGDETFYKPYATSLRSGGLGYQSSTQAALLNVCYNSLENYTATLRHGITTQFAPYQALEQHKTTQFAQVNTNILQSEAEFYSSVRAKSNPPPGQNFLKHLDATGVGYIEVRMLDINPYLPLGVSAEQLNFMDLLLLHCMLTPSPEHDERLCQEAVQNFTQATEAGRKPGLILENKAQPINLQAWARTLFEALYELADILDPLHQTTRYKACLDALIGRVDDPDRTPSGQILKDLMSQSVSLIDHHRQLSRRHHQDFMTQPIEAPVRQAFDEIAARSRRDFDQIPANRDEDFSEFLANYHKAYE